MRVKLVTLLAWGFVLVCLVVPGGLLRASSDGEESGTAERTFEVTYRFIVRGIPAEAKAVTAWVPIPATNAHQKLEDMRVGGGWPYTLVAEPEYGNRYLRFDLSGAAAGALDAAAARVDSAAVDSATVAVTFRVERRAYRVLGSGSAAPASEVVSRADAVSSAETISSAERSRFLAPDRLVPTGGKIAEEAAHVAGGAEAVPARARRLYDHIVESVRYDKSGTGWGRGDALYACDARAGNCTDFHSLFIGEARALHIPARFVMGLPVPEDRDAGTIPGYHCWAEFAADGVGWVPVDASEASKHPERREELFGGLDANRVQFTIGRDIRLPGAHGEPLNFSIHPYVEVDGKAHPGVEASYSFAEVRSAAAGG